MYEYPTSGPYPFPPAWAPWVPNPPAAARAGARWSRLAVFSLALGLPGLYLGVFLVPQVLAITLGIVAHQRIATTGQRGRRLAIAGIVVGSVELLLWVLFLVALVVATPGPGPGSAIMG